MFFSHHESISLYIIAMARTPIEAAATSLNCAVNPNLNTQKHYYFKNCKATAPSSDARYKYV